MSQKSFHGLGVSQACRRRARSPLHPRALLDPGARPAGRARRARRPGEVADRLGQDPGLRAADRRARRAARREAERARARPHARARPAGDRRACSGREAEGPAHRLRLRRRPPQEPGREGARGARRRRHARPARGSRAAPHAGASTGSASSCSTRPTACWTWVSSRRWTSSSAACRGSARRCSSRRRSTARSASSRRPTRRARRASRPSSPPTVPAARSSTASSPSTSRRRWRRSSRTSRSSTGLTLVFVRTKRGADRLVSRLRRHGVKAEALHGDMSQSSRRRALDRFDRGTVSVLVATDVAARGLDIDDVEHVINYDPPEEDKGYLHRTGRTGRGPERDRRDVRPPGAAGGDEPRGRPPRPPRAVREPRGTCSPRGRSSCYTMPPRAHAPSGRPPSSRASAARSRC